MTNWLKSEDEPVTKWQVIFPADFADNADENLINFSAN